MKRSSATLKASAREILSGKYGFLIVDYMIIAFCSIIPNIIITTILDPGNTVSLITCQILIYMVSLLISLIMAGFKYTMLNIVRGKKFNIADLFFAFSHHPDRFLVVNLILLLAEILATLPFTIMNYSSDSAALSSEMLLLSLAGGILGSIVTLIVGLFFGMANYLLLDNMDMGAMEALKGSMALMRGNKGRLFYINLSFLPLMIACLFTCYIGFLWLEPYIEATLAYFYLDVTGELDRPRQEEETEIPKNPVDMY